MRFSPLLIGAALLLTPALASADVDCAALKDAKAISQHYVQPVLDRADAGIAYAAKAQTNTDFFSFYLPWWARSIGGTFAAIIEPQQDLIVESNDLSTTTACLRFDQILIECKIDAVRQALDTELSRGSYVAIMRLQSLVIFLQQRLNNLQLGSADGTYEDTTWTDQRIFDEQPPAKLDGPLCPFHSDYTPPRMTGYGCDSSVLGTIGGYGLGFVDAENQGLASIEGAIDKFRQIIPLIQSITPGYTGGAGVPTSVSSREHKTIIGCQEETGTCSDDATLVCGSDEFCASQGEGTCNRDATKPTIPKRALRGPFSYQRDHLQILTDFVEKRIEDGLSRTFPAAWAPAADLPAGGADAKTRQSDDGLLTGVRSELQSFFQAVSGVQGREEGAIFPEAQDSQLEIADSLSDMRVSIGELSRLSSTKTGVRGFILDLAYFLRRTCAFRPCQKSLEQVIRIDLQDACFPYTNGDFLQDSPDSPRWKKCAEAACIQVPGANLPQSCYDILP